MGAKLFPASALPGHRVMNPAGEELGQIEDVMIDVESGRVAYAVLALGGLLGFGERLYPVPWGALRLPSELFDEMVESRPTPGDWSSVSEEQPLRVATFILDIPKTILEKAPGFDKGSWPNMADQQWGADIHAYYGYEPYWKKYRDVG